MSALSQIRAGDRVTIVNRFGQQRTGRAVMRGPHGWVLNMGGKHGTPGIASEENIVKVSKARARGASSKAFDDCVERTFVDAAARALFVSAWGHYEEEHGRSHGGVDLMDIAPPTPAVAKKAAKALAKSIAKMNGGRSVCELFEVAKAAPGRHRRPPTVEDFGHCLAMESLGHGVSWFDDHPEFPLKIPHGEFHMFGKRDIHFGGWDERDFGR